MKPFLILLAAAGLIYLLGFWLPNIAAGNSAPMPGDDTVPAATTTSPSTGRVVTLPPVLVPTTYDGHDARWWAARARRNGVRMRAAQAALRAGVGLGARQLTTAHTSPAGLVHAFLCIHRFEAAWDSTSNPTYDGGLQMDDRFQASYGAAFVRAWGPAYNWPPFVQLTVAMSAYLSGRGFYPWPNTARACGLLR